MDDRSARHSFLLSIATLSIEAFVVVHLLGVFSFAGPIFALGLFVLAGVAFQRLRRAEEAIHPPPEPLPAPFEPVSPSNANAGVTMVALGFAAFVLFRMFLS